MQNTVVARYPDGTLVKGVTNNFFPNKSTFHIEDRGSGERREITTAELKAVFFVKDFEGDSTRDDRADVDRTGFGRKMQVEFQDGETMVGFCQAYAANRPGFFLFPADPESNNDRVFIVAKAVRSAEFV
jgi:hypothetical protein